MAVAETIDGEAAPARVSPYRYVVLGALCVVYTLNFLDRQFLSTLGESVRKDLHLSDTQFGTLTGLYFALFYTIIGVPVGLLADRTNRVRIVAVACFLWSLFTGACGAATSFMSLAIPRMGVGVGEAGGAPPSYSIISDYFPATDRGSALGLFSLGVPLGTMFGIAAGSTIDAIWGWRTAFYVLGAIGMVIAPIFYLVVREPKRGAHDAPIAVPVEGPVEKAGLFDVIVLFFTTPKLYFTGIAAGLTAFVGYALLTFGVPYFQRAKHMSKLDTAEYYSIVLGVSMMLGTWLAGYIVDKVGPKWPRGYAMVPGIAILLALPFTIGMAWAPTWQLGLLFLVGPSILNIAYLAPALAVVQNSVPAHQRVTAGALLLFLLNLIGLGGGPLFIGMMSDYFKPHYGLQSLTMAFYSLSPFFVLAFLAQVIAGHFIAKDARVAK